MKVFVTGGTGFVGGHVVRHLVDEGIEVTMLVRKGSEGKVPPPLRSRMEIVAGDIFNGHELSQMLDGCDAVVNLIGIIRDIPSKGITFERVHFEVAKALSDAAREKRIVRFLQVSALGVDWDERTEYFRSKWKADQYLIDHDHQFTIFRPSVIFGEGDGFVNTLASLIKQSPLMIIPGDGSYPLQPVFVGDLARAIGKSLKEGRGKGKIFTVTGPDTFTYKETLSLVGEAMGKKRRAIHIPLGIIIPFVILLERFQSFPLTYDQLYMLTRGSVGDNGPFLEEFELTLTSFADYLERTYRSSNDGSR